MPRAAKICSAARCSNLQPCPDHKPKPWATSKRSARAVAGSVRQKTSARIMRRHRGVCHVCGKPDADQVDHVIPLAEGGADNDSNLRPIHAKPCHQQKTAAESARARRCNTPGG